MLPTLITSKTRIKVLTKFFINSNVKGYLRNLETEFGESCNAIRIELNRFEKAGFLTSSVIGNKKMYSANTLHPSYSDLQFLVHKMIGIDQIVKNILERTDKIEAAFLSGKIAQGIDSCIIDLIMVGNQIDKTRINTRIEKVENKINRKIRYIILTHKEVEDLAKDSLLYPLSGPSRKNYTLE